MHEMFARWLDERGEGDELVGTHLERAATDAQRPAGRAALAHDASARLAAAANARSCPSTTRRLRTARARGGALDEEALDGSRSSAVWGLR